MTSNGPEHQASDSVTPRVSRRRYLGGIAGGAALLGTGGVVGARSPGFGRGYPPKGTTTWSAPINLGNGQVRTFTTVTPSGVPKAHGMYMDRTALEGLPSVDDLENDDEKYTDKYGPDGEALQIHFKWSLEFFVPIPATPSTPFTFLGLNWNPGGHPPAGVWTDPHFDIHFHMLPMSTVDAITGPAAPTYQLPARYIPEGYVRGPIVNERVITDMGEHMVDPTVPELNGGTFDNTLIWGAYDPQDDGVAELTFVEPMITRAYLKAHTGVVRNSVAQPDVYARSGTYPTSYVVRDVPNDDAVVVAVERFEDFDGEN